MAESKVGYGYLIVTGLGDPIARTFRTNPGDAWTAFVGKGRTADDRKRAIRMWKKCGYRSANGYWRPLEKQ